MSDVGGSSMKEGVGLNDVITKRQITRRESMNETLKLVTLGSNASTLVAKFDPSCVTGSRPWVGRFEATGE